MEKYGRLKAIEAPPRVGEKLFDQLPAKAPSIMGKDSDMPDKKSGLSWNLLSTLFS